MTKPYKMNAARLARWIAQLRSPRAQKCEEFYFDVGGKCWLNDKEIRELRDGTGPICACANGHYLVANIDDLGGENISISLSNVPYVIGPTLHDEVIGLNDRNEDENDPMGGLTLSEMADWLEANVEPV